MSKEAKDILEKIPGSAGDSMEIVGLVLTDILDKLVRLITGPIRKSK